MFLWRPAFWRVQCAFWSWSYGLSHTVVDCLVIDSLNGQDVGLDGLNDDCLGVAVSRVVVPRDLLVDGPMRGPPSHSGISACGSDAFHFLRGMATRAQRAAFTTSSKSKSNSPR